MACRSIALASRNPVKARAVLSGFGAMFPGEPFDLRAVSVPSGVADQPCSDAETLRGAYQRARAAAAASAPARPRFAVGVEGGVEEDPDGGMCAFAWVVVLSEGVVGRSRTATFSLPAEVARLVRSGMELGDADDLVFEQQGSKRKGGAVGLLTRNAVDREALYAQAVALALVPFKNPSLYARAGN